MTQATQATNHQATWLLAVGGQAATKVGSTAAYRNSYAGSCLTPLHTPSTGFSYFFPMGHGWCICCMTHCTTHDLWGWEHCMTHDRQEISCPRVMGHMMGMGVTLAYAPGWPNLGYTVVLISFWIVFREDLWILRKLSLGFLIHQRGGEIFLLND